MLDPGCYSQDVSWAAAKTQRHNLDQRHRIVPPRKVSRADEVGDKYYRIIR